MAQRNSELWAAQAGVSSEGQAACWVSGKLVFFRAGVSRPSSQNVA